MATKEVSTESKKSAIEKMTDATLSKKREEHRALSEQQDRLMKRRRVQARSVFGRAAALFRFPFGGNAFSAMWDACLFLGATLIFATVASFVVLGMLICLILNGIYTVLFGLCYPLFVLFYLAFGGAISARTEARLSAVEGKLKKIDMIAIEREIALRERKSRSADSSYKPSSSGVENTEYYKEQKDKYYRQYMGFPPKEEKGLSDLATDTALDIDVGDY